MSPTARARCAAGPVAPRLAIVGAGLAGLTLATLLARRGLDVVTLERHARPAQAGEDGRSINLALSFRGLRALDRIGLGRAVASVVVPMRGRMVHAGGRAAFQSYDLTGDRTIFSVRRADLLALLYDTARTCSEVRLGADCTAVDVETGALRVRARDGALASLAADGVVGADGVGSIVRRELVRDAGVRAEPRIHPHGYKELAIPAEAARRARLEREALHVWPRGDFMLIALPNRAGDFTSTLFLPTQGPDGFEALGDARAVERFFARHFPDARALFPSLVDDFLARPVGRIGTVLARPWARGRAVILGDAAHAMAPFYGQGMNCALEDCLELDRAVGDAPTLAGAFAAFSRRRYADAAAIVALSHENYAEMRAGVASAGLADVRRTEGMLQRRYPDRFLPLYAMVAFTAMPYRVARERADIQADIVRRLHDGTSARATPDLAAVDALVARRLPPLAAVLPEP